MNGDDELRREILALAAEDRLVRAELATDGSLFDGYHPRMEAVHRRNAARLAAILDRHALADTMTSIEIALDVDP